MTITWDAYRLPAGSMLDAVGRTPLVRLRRLSPEGHELLVKVEWYGPTGSTKDRIYAHMVARAEERGRLTPQMTILECTTGNAGIACAAVAAMKGYACTIVMPEGMSEERKKLILAYGAELVLTPGGESDIDLALARKDELLAAEPDRYWVPAEFDNPDNTEAHELSSAREIWEQTGGEVDAVVAAQGTGGWISGVGRFAKRQDPRIRVYAAEPAECALISKRQWGTHGIAGIGDGIVPQNLDLEVLDGIVTISTEEALETARQLARQEAILSGPSGGCNVAASLKVARAHPDLHTIVTLIPDTAMRYFSGALFGERTYVEIPDRSKTIDPGSEERLNRSAQHLEILDGDDTVVGPGHAACSTGERPA
jgi:cysteine synthase A